MANIRRTRFMISPRLTSALSRARVDTANFANFQPGLRP